MKVSDIKEGLEKSLATNDLWFQWLMMEKMQVQMLLHTDLHEYMSGEQLLQLGEYYPAVDQQILVCITTRQRILMQLESIGIQFPEN